MSMESTEKRQPWGESQTIQSQEPETNINQIMKRWERTGELTHVSRAIAQYRDMTGIPDLEGALNIVADAQSIFEEMPAEVRKACDHNVAKFLPFIDDPGNLERCIELKILPPKMVEEELPLKGEAIAVPSPPNPESPPEG